MAITVTIQNQESERSSTHKESEDVKAALNLGAASFLAKPYTITQLGQAVFRAINPTQHEDQR